MKTKQRFLFTLLMAIVMMAISPQLMWAQEEGGSAVDNLDYLCFTAEEAGATVALVKSGDPNAISMEYSTDKASWTAYTANTVLTLASVGDKVYFRAGGTSNAQNWYCSGHCYKFQLGTAKVAASGNVMSLLDATCQSLTVLDKQFVNLFKECSSLTSAPSLPATTLGSSCYGNMFKGCTSLTSVPSALPAETLAEGCYNQMFYGCTSLETAPEIMATTLGKESMRYMFDGCTGLNSVTVHFTDWNSSNDATYGWLDNTAASGSFTCPEELTISERGYSTVPAGWSVNGEGGGEGGGSEGEGGGSEGEGGGSESTLPVLVAGDQPNLVGATEGQNLSYQFTPATTGNYCFYSLGEGDWVFISVADANDAEMPTSIEWGVMNQNSGDFYVMTTLTAGQTYTFQFTPYEEVTDYEVYLKYTTEEFTPKSNCYAIVRLYNGETLINTNGDITNTQVAWFTYEGSKRTYEYIPYGNMEFKASNKVHGFHFTGWYKDGQLVSSESTYTANVNANSYDMYAHYQADEENADFSGKSVVSVKTYNSGSGTPSAGLQGYDGACIAMVANGTSVTVESTATEGNTFSEIGGYSSPNGNYTEIEYTATNPLTLDVNGDTYLTAIFNASGSGGGEEPGEEPGEQPGEEPGEEPGGGSNIIYSSLPVLVEGDEPNLVSGGNGETLRYQFTPSTTGNYCIYSLGDKELGFETIEDTLGHVIPNAVEIGKFEGHSRDFYAMTTLEKDSTYMIVIYSFDAITDYPVYLKYTTEEFTPKANCNVPIKLLDQEGSEIYYGYNSSLAYVLDDGIRATYVYAPYGDVTFHALDNAHGFSFIGWHNDEGELLSEDYDYTADVQENDYYIYAYYQSDGNSNQSVVSVAVYNEGTGEATAEIDGFDGACVALVTNGSTITVKTSSTAGSRFEYIDGYADHGEEYYTEEKSLTFTVAGNTWINVYYSNSGNQGEHEHVWGDTLYAAATCTHDGYHYHVCADDGEWEVVTWEGEEVDSALGHIDEDEDGFCDRCGALIGKDPILVTEANLDSLGLAAEYIGAYAISNLQELAGFAQWYDGAITKATEEAVSTPVIPGEPYEAPDVRYVLTADIAVNTNLVGEDGEPNEYDDDNQFRTDLLAWTAPVLDGRSATFTFDGNGHTISGLYQNAPTKLINGMEYLGMFAQTKGSVNIWNFTLTDSYFGAKTDSLTAAGSLVAYAEFVQMDSCHSDAVVKAVKDSEGCEYWSYAGGLVGQIRGGCISNSYFDGQVSSDICDLGGIAGYVYTDKQHILIEDCHSSGMFNLGDDVYFGGITKEMHGVNYVAAISRCYSDAQVTGTPVEHKIAGIAVRLNAEMENGAVRIVNCYNDLDVLNLDELDENSEYDGIFTSFDFEAGEDSKSYVAYNINRDAEAWNSSIGDADVDEELIMAANMYPGNSTDVEGGPVMAVSAEDFASGWAAYYLNSANTNQPIELIPSLLPPGGGDDDPGVIVPIQPGDSSIVVPGIVLGAPKRVAADEEPVEELEGPVIGFDEPTFENIWFQKIGFDAFPRLYGDTLTVVYQDEEDDNIYYNIRERLGKFTLVDGETYDRAATDVDTLKYTRTFGGTNWTTWYVPFELTLTDEICAKYDFSRINNVHQYDDNDDDVADRTVIESFRQKSGKKLKANYPYLVRVKDMADKDMEVTLSDITLAKAEANSYYCMSMDYQYTFTGTYIGMDDSGEGMDKPMTLFDDESTQMWYNFESLAPQRHYLTITSRDGSNMSVAEAATARIILSVDGEEDANGIVTLYDNQKAEPETFDLMGRRVDGNIQRGLIIKNGQISFVK